MKQLILIFSMSFSLFSCYDSGKDPANTTLNKTPETFQETNYKYISSRGKTTDVMLSLYEEQLEKDSSLKTLDNEIIQIYAGVPDSLLSYQKFNENNDGYYNSATNHVSLMKDSLLKKKILARIETSLNNYKGLILKHEELKEAMESKETKIQDLYTVLKVMITLPVIEKYQEKNLPSNKSLVEMEKEMDRVIEKLEGRTN